MGWFGASAVESPLPLPHEPAGLLVPVLAGGSQPGVLLILLDGEVQAERLAQLIEAHLGQPFGPPLDVLVTRAGEVAFRSSPDLTEAEMARADVVAPLGGAQELQLESQGEDERQVTVTRGHEGLAVVEVANVRGAPDGGSPVDFHRTLVAAPWEIRVRHRAGSIEAAVGSMRRRNLATSLSILSVLGVAAGLLLVAAQRARRLARQQMEFVAGITHELRTPLTVIRSAAENLLDGVVREPEQAQRYGRILHDEGKRLEDLVEQALALGGARSQRHPEPEPVDLHDLLPAALQRWRTAHGEDAPSVELTLPAEVPVVTAHRIGLEQVLTNLLANAVKYGGPPIGVQVTTQANDRVDVTVWDRGAGIPAAERPHLFDPFFRGREARALQVPGSGLGLSVVKSTVDGWGGRVSVRSEPGQGSAFTLHLPVAQS